MRKSAYFAVAVALLAPSPCSSAQSIQTISLPTNHMVYDPVSGMLFATVPSSAGSNGNSIATIDPNTASVVKTVFIGSEPDPIAVSGDGQFLYAGLDGADAVRRYTIATGTAGLQFTIGSDPFFGPYLAGEIAVLPGAPHSVAVTRDLSGGDPANNGVAIYDDGVQRPNVVTRGAEGETDSIAFSNSASTLYAQNNEDSGFQFSTLAVDASGVSLSSFVAHLFPSYFATILYDGASGSVYATTGQFADPVIPSLSGQFTQTASAYNYLAAAASIVGIAPDTPAGRIFFLLEDAVHESSSVTLTSFDTTTLLPVGSLVIPNVLTPNDLHSNASDLILWGTGGLAFRTSNGQIFLVAGRNFPGLASFQLSSHKVVGGTTLTGTVALTATAPAGGVTIYLRSSDPSVATSASVTVPSGQTSANTSIATIAGFPSQDVAVNASYGVQSIAQSVSVLSSPTAPVYPANVRVLHLATNDLVYDPTTQMLLASVPSSVASIGNSIAAIDPAKGAVVSSVFLGSEPDQLAISSDDAFVYAGLSGAAAIRRLDVSTMMPDIQYSLGNDPLFGPKFPAGLISLPGQPHSLAVSGRPPISPGIAGIAVYDDNIERPVVYDGFTGGETIAPGATAGRLYGFDNQFGPWEFDRFTVDSGGIALLDSTDSLTSGFGVQIKYAGAKLFASDGQVFDPENRILLGTCDGLYESATVLPDPVHGKVYFLNTDISGNTSLLIFNSSTFLEVAAYPLPGVMGQATSLTRWRPHRLAFRTTAGQVYFVNAGLPTVLAVKLSPSTVVGTTTSTGTVTLTNVAPLGGVVVRLARSNPAVAAVPSMVTIASGSDSATFPVATNRVATTTMVTISATYAGKTRSAVLTVNP